MLECVGEYYALTIKQKSMTYLIDRYKKCLKP